MELSKILKEIENSNYKKITIQVPDGLKKEAINIANKIENMNKKALIVSAPCYGACDLPYNYILDANCDCLITVGHSKFNKDFEEKIPTYYCEWPFEGNSLEILKKNISKIKENKIGLVSTIQHVHKLDKMKEILEKEGKLAIIGKKGLRATEKGQILGCDVGSAEKIQKGIDCFIYVGSGVFHPQKLAELGKTIYQLNPYSGSFEKLTINFEKSKQKEILKVLKHQDEKKWGIILSSKPGQFFPELAEQIKTLLEKKKKEVFVFISDKILESEFIGFGIKIYVNTACPRISDDFEELTLVNPWTLKYLE